MDRALTSRLLFGALIVLLYLFLLLPVLAVTYVSFFDSQFLSFPPPGYTLRWFANVLEQEALISGFVTSAEVALLASLIGVVSGVLASLALVHFEFPGREAIKSFLLAPLLVPGIVIGTALYIFYIQIAQSTGWNPTRSLTGLVVAHVMLTIPWSVRLIAASMGMLDRSVEEAARNLGARRAEDIRPHHLAAHARRHRGRRPLLLRHQLREPGGLRAARPAWSHDPAHRDASVHRVEHGPDTGCGQRRADRHHRGAPADFRPFRQALTGGVIWPSSKFVIS